MAAGTISSFSSSATFPFQVSGFLLLSPQSLTLFPPLQGPSACSHSNPQFSQEGQSFCPPPLSAVIHSTFLRNGGGGGVGWGLAHAHNTSKNRFQHFTGFNIFQAALSHLIRSGPAGLLLWRRVDIPLRLGCLGWKGSTRLPPPSDRGSSGPSGACRFSHHFLPSMAAQHQDSLGSQASALLP